MFICIDNDSAYLDWFYDILSIIEFIHSFTRQLFNGSIGSDESIRNKIFNYLFRSFVFVIIVVQMVILDLFYDLLNLDTPTICDNYETALKSTCKYEFIV